MAGGDRRFHQDAAPALNSRDKPRWTPARTLVPKLVVGCDLWRVHGTAKFFGQVLPWMLHRRYFLYEGSPGSVWPESRVKTQAHLTVAELDDLPLLLRVRPGYYDLRCLRERLRRGHICFVAWHGRDAVGIRWAFRGAVYLPYLSRTLILAPSEVYFDEVYTVPRYRRQGIDDQNMRFMLSWFKERGFRTHLCLLTSFDTGLHRRYESFGMKRTGEVSEIGFPGKKIYRFKGRLRESGGRIIWLA
jgi:GNAT superfamily N-acetyltransferase